MQIKAFLFGAAFLLAGPLSAAEQLTLSAELEPLRPYIGKTWRGQLSQPGQPEMIDISRWERALNGTAIKISHSVNQGEYGGETILFYDKKQQSLAYYYFTTAGFYTHGTMSIDNKTKLLTAEETVENNAKGITKVRSISKLSENTLTTTSEYLQQGKWVAGHSAVYTEAPDAKVVFK
ncbi:MAG: hypothetical protein E6Q75_14025 [Rheinheimera sp.]|nr:MAG: hypothetical protein E6Q75_14025 [Rheinheimera sp.]